MLSDIDSNPALAILWIALGIGLIVLCVVLWFQLQQRSRRYGGGTLAAVVMAAAIVGLLVAIAPNFLPIDIGIFLLIFSLMAIYRPDQVVKATGGARIEWRALREGRELQLMVKEHGGPSLARQNPEVQERFERLSALEAPTTDEYIGLLRETLLEDPDEPGMDAKLAELAQADAALRTAIGARPTWEKELERRAAAGAPVE